MYSATANRARARVLNACRWYISFFRVAKNDSAAALSQHTPVRPRLRRIRFRAVNASNSADVYWADSTGRRNTPITGGVTMGRTAAWVSTKTGRAPMRSPGRPPPRRDVERTFWVKIAAGLSSEDAAVAGGVSGPVGSRWFRQRGGMSASIRKGPSAGRYLSFAEREEIALLRAQGAGVREMARRAGRAASTISRELRRNAATRGGNLDYRATTAQWHAERAARRPKPAKLASHAPLRSYVQERLSGLVTRPDGGEVNGPAVPWKGRRHGPRQHRRWARAWSPQQIAARLRLDYPDDESMRISHEAIYQALYVQGRGALKRALTQCLRTGRALRVPRARAQSRGKSFVTSEVLISERPAEAEDRAVPGH